MKIVHDCLGGALEFASSLKIQLLKNSSITFSNQCTCQTVSSRVSTFHYSRMLELIINHVY